jgi:hypothetical protein
VLITRLPKSLGPLLDRQHNVVSRGQLLAAGVDDGTTYRKVRTGHWQRLLPGIFLVAPGSPGTEQRRVAAALFAGEQAQLTGLSVLHWYGFRSAPATDRVHVLVPHDVHRRSTGFVVVQRALSLDERARHGGLYWVTSPARAVVDACRALTQLRDVRAIVAEAVQAHHTSPQAIDAELRRAARSRTGLARRALNEVLAGVRSAPEAELRELTLQSKILPPILWNPTLTTLDGHRLPTPDGWIDDVGLALQVDSAEYHARGTGWTDTLDRHNELAKHDVQVLHITPTEIRTVPRKVLATIEQAYRARLASGVRARVVATPISA